MIERDDFDPFTVDSFTEERPAQDLGKFIAPAPSAQRDYLASPISQQLAHWQHGLGLTWSGDFYLELLRELEIPWLQPLLEAGRDWVQIYLLPRDDRLGMLEYMAHSNRTPGLIWRCRYKQGGWHDFHTGQLIHGVTHWRIAQPGEGATEIDPDALPGGYLGR